MGSKCKIWLKKINANLASASWELALASCSWPRPLLASLTSQINQSHRFNKAFIDIRLRHGIATPLSRYGLLRTNVTSSIKPEVHNVSQHRHRKRKPQPQGICTKNFVKIGPVVPEICSQTDRQTHTYRQTDWSQYSAPLPRQSKYVDSN